MKKTKFFSHIFSELNVYTASVASVIGGSFMWLINHDIIEADSSFPVYFSYFLITYGLTGLVLFFRNLYQKGTTKAQIRFMLIILFIWLGVLSLLFLFKEKYLHKFIVFAGIILSYSLAAYTENKNS